MIQFCVINSIRWSNIIEMVLDDSVAKLLQKRKLYICVQVEKVSINNKNITNLIIYG